MSCTVLFRPLAVLELLEAVMWYEARRHGLGLELKEEVDTALERAAESPQRFPRVHGEVRPALLRPSDD